MKSRKYDVFVIGNNRLVMQFQIELKTQIEKMQSVNFLTFMLSQTVQYSHKNNDH